jgi:hypothetical protein
MLKRPISVTIIGWLYIIAGSVGLAYHSTELKPNSPAFSEAVLVCLVRFLAIIGGIYTLRGQNWARWLLVLWMAYHVVLGLAHSLNQTFTHAIFLAVIAYFLFRPTASTFFAKARTN